MSSIQLATNLIKKWEGCKLTAYQCSAGVWTIGYGSTFYEDGKSVKKGDKITQLRAETLLNHTVTSFHSKVDMLVTSAVNDNQLAALVSFAFNVGLDIDADFIAEGLGDSTLLKKVNANPKDATIRSEFMKWVNAKGKKVGGLVNRRKDEADLYFRA